MTNLNKAFRNYTKGTKTERQLEKLMDAVREYIKGLDGEYFWSSENFKDWFGTFRNAEYFLEINKNNNEVCLGERKPKGDNVYISFDECDLESMVNKFLGLA